MASPLASCGWGSSDAPQIAEAPDRAARGTDLQTEIAFAKEAAPGPLLLRADGSLVVGERSSGRILVIPTAPSTDAIDAADLDVLATVEVDVDVGGQRGLLGLAEVDDDLYAAWTRPSDGHLVVAQVTGLTGDEQRLVWEGPKSTDLANGGHLDVNADGQILIGIGDLQNPDLIDDPLAPNGKILSLDPAGPPDQNPRMLSSGWNNPYAFVVTEDGKVWVADNAPGDKAEKFGRGDVADAERVDLEGGRAPSALIDLGGDQLGVCSYLDGTMLLIALRPQPTAGDLLAARCKTGGASLGDDRIAVSDDGAVELRYIPPKGQGS